MYKTLLLIIFPGIIFSAQFDNLLPTISLQPLWASKSRTSNYHGKFGYVGIRGLDPAFEPYSSFIFESALYKTDKWYEGYLIPHVYGDSRGRNERFLDHYQD